MSQIKMVASLITVGIAIAAFAATNIDDIFVLMALFASPKLRVREVVIGQYLGIGALTLSSLALALAAMKIPPANLRFLGLLPLLLGIKGLWELRDREAVAGHASELQAARASKILAVAAVTLANSGDNLAVFVPLFSTRSADQNALIVAVFLAMTALWCFLGHYLVNHPYLAKPILRYGHLALPIVLIAIGSLILVGR